MIKLTHVITVAAALAIALPGVASAQRGERGDRVNQNRAGVERTTRHDTSDSRIDRRQANQRARINDGRDSGSLTRREMGRLRGDQRRIRHMERHFARDGRIDRWERRALRHAQNRASRRIARAKHNRRYRGNGHGGWQWSRRVDEYSR